ncbi:MAG: mechanosensitive ion channel [candidate division Zixibacteria bacterium]|nr:mechanosensitive ion channel [candidate division Zixibacteria bacterium]
MEEYLNMVIEWGSVYGLKVIAAIAIFIIGRFVIGIITGIVKRIMKKSNTDETLVKFLVSLTRTALLMILFIAVLNQLGVQTTSFVAIIGAVGLAIGFALQGSLANFASGVLLIAFRPFKAGDFVEAGGTVGVIEEISMFSTIMKTPDNKKIIIPNSNITGGNITNYSAKETRRVDMVFGIGYDDDIKKAKQLLEKIVSEDERILKDPAPVVAVSELADSSVNFVVRPWVKSSDYWGVYWDLMEKVKLTFDEEKISIPYPQQDVHMHQVVSV